MGNAIWELYCAEHAIGADGFPKEAPHEMECQSTFFYVSPKGQYVPRCLFIDLEASVVGCDFCTFAAYDGINAITTHNNSIFSLIGMCVVVLTREVPSNSHSQRREKKSA
ncbi:unnamed protein product [Protopolystoma xenopodis]|uniref:Uncharacterized protein n=1 Tax=Protopolystoma xenopodis TaxID=117903 RepID=A0A3S5B1V9_9PLAT|nr:unnamed protein product [Protopolystoma xenopodis]